ncbi:MAG: hypothetical protein RLZZ584_4644, partial [Pseudomonadota bacterium]
FLELVHRLDKETSGILLVAKKRSALTALQEQFRQRRTDKQYSTLVIGDWPAGLGRIEVALVKTLDAQGERRVRVAGSVATTAAAAPGRRNTRRGDDDEEDDSGMPSLTLVRPRERLPGATLLDVTIRTGRTHQIRVHLQHAGYPIVGDDKYGDFELNHAWSRQGVARAGDAAAPRLRFERMFLHARRLAFDHPASGARISLQAALPADCLALLRHLGASAATLEALAHSNADVAAAASTAASSAPPAPAPAPASRPRPAPTRSRP